MSLDIALHKQIENRVDAQPDALALVQGDLRWSYRDLEHRANVLAHALKAYPEARFIVPLLNDLPSSLVASLAVMKAGKVIARLSPKVPIAVIQSYLAPLAPVLLITTEDTRAIGDALPFPNLRLDMLNFDQPTTRLSAEVLDPNDLNTLVSTSGSTGTPKAIMRTHQAESQGASSSIKAMQLTPKDTVFVLGDAAFAAFNSTANATLLVGATLYTIDFQNADLTAIHQQLRAERITVISTGASSFRSLFATAPDHHFPDVRLIRLGREPVMAADFALFKQKFAPPTLLVQSLGMTEVGVVARFSATHDTVVTTPTLPVGKPVGHTEILLWDEDGQPVPQGEAGEIVVRSKTLALGYFNNPTLTAEKFLADPHDSAYRLYKSGDLGRFDAEGNLIHLGRKDFMVKIRGFRIELSAIETRLLEHPAVAHAVVHPYQAHAQAEPRLVAYVVPKTDQALPSFAAVRAFLSETLADYMLPTALVTLEKLPRVPNGKIDRKALPAPQLEQANVTAPATPTEQKLHQLWQATFETNTTLDIHTDFFALGGDSLKALNMMSAVNQAFTVTMTPAILYQYPTIAKLASIIADDSIKTLLPKDIVPLQTAGTRPTILYFPGAEGSGLEGLELSRRLGNHQPFLAFQFPGVDGREPFITEREVLLERYLRGIDALRIRAPIYLIGFSGGGLFAYELALRLTQRGMTVLGVVMIDTAGRQNRFSNGVGFPKAALSRQRQVFIEVTQIQVRLFRIRMTSWMHSARTLLSRWPTQWPAWFAERAERKRKESKNPMRKQLQHQTPELVLPNRLNPFDLARFRYAAQTMSQMWRNYQPQSTTLSVLYIQAMNQDTPHRANAQYWQGLVTGPFMLKQINGPHVLINPPYVDEVAEHIQAFIASQT